MMKEAANSLLKILEEPPDTVNIIILAENPGELLPTIRSRCATVRLGALPVEEIESLLAYRRPDVPPKQRALIARLSQGAAGRALAFDLEAYTAARPDPLIFLHNAAAGSQAGDKSGAPSFPASSQTGVPSERSSLAGVERVGSSPAGASGPASETWVHEPDHTALFKMTETYRAGADGQ